MGGPLPLGTVSTAVGSGGFLPQGGDAATDRVRTESLPLLSCVTVGKSHIPSVPQFTLLSDNAFLRVAARCSELVSVVAQPEEAQPWMSWGLRGACVGWGHGQRAAAGLSGSVGVERGLRECPGVMEDIGVS